MSKNYLVMILDKDPKRNAFWAKRLYNYTDDKGKHIHRYSHKEVAREDARKFTQLLGLKYELYRIT